MDEKLKTELTEALKTAGFVDGEALALNAFDKIRDGLKSSADVPRAVAEMRRAKPNLFAAWRDDADFEKRELQMRDGFARDTANADDLRAALKAVDPSRLSAEHFNFYEAALACITRGDFSAVDNGKLCELAHRQKGVAA